jgi:hypothetical protein
MGLALERQGLERRHITHDGTQLPLPDPAEALLARPDPDRRTGEVRGVRRGRLVREAVKRSNVARVDEEDVVRCQGHVLRGRYRIKLRCRDLLRREVRDLLALRACPERVVQEYASPDDAAVLNPDWRCRGGLAWSSIGARQSKRAKRERERERACFTYHEAHSL